MCILPLISDWLLSSHLKTRRKCSTTEHYRNWSSMFFRTRFSMFSIVPRSVGINNEDEKRVKKWDDVVKTRREKNIFTNFTTIFFMFMLPLSHCLVASSAFSDFRWWRVFFLSSHLSFMQKVEPILNFYKIRDTFHSSVLVLN